MILFVYASYVEPHLFRIESRTLQYEYLSNDNDVNQSKGLKIVQFTDTQLGPYYSIEQFEKVIHRINDQEADIIVFTGDLFDIPREYEYKTEALQILKKLDPKAIKLAVFGNHDIGGGGSGIYEDFMAEAGFMVLVNEMISYKAENGKIYDFYGIDDGMLGRPDFEIIKPYLDEAHYNVLLLHEPDLYVKVDQEPFDLILSGHSHGGQIRVPFFSPVITPPLSKIYTNGYYEIENARNSLLFVNTGLGNTKMKYRFGNIPEIAVFNIE